MVGFGLGGGVYVFDGTTFKVSGSPKIINNYSENADSNVMLDEVNGDEDEEEGLYLIDAFTGEIRITIVEEEEPFGIVLDNSRSAENFKANGGSGLYGCVDGGGKLYRGPVERSSSSSKSQGTSVWLMEQQYTVTFYQDKEAKEVYQKQTVSAGQTAAVPSPEPTAEGYRVDGWYTDTYSTGLYDFSSKVYSDLALFSGWEEIPAVKPVANQPTGKSPAPFIGLLAGLGAAAAVLFSLRRK